MKRVNNIRDFMKKIGSLAKRPATKIIIGTLLYIGLTASYVSPVLVSCSERFIGVPGDQTVFAWLSEASPNSPPFWGETALTNAPFGEDLYEPMHITGLVPYTATWVMNKVVSPNCSFNILMASGFILTSVVTFLFIAWLLRGRSYLAAWFGGYLAAFTPYLMAKTPYHVSYVYCGLLVGVIWLLLALWRKWGYKLAAGLMLLTAIIFYHDPYFIQLVIVVYGSFFVGLALYVWRDKLPWKKVWVFLKRLLVVSPILLVLISPMIITRVVYKDQIDTVVANSRDNDIISEGLAYGARPWEFIFPSTYNPLLPEKLVALKLDKQHGSNPAETTLYLGVVPLGLTIWLIWMFARKKVRKSEINSIVESKLLVWVMVALIVISGLFSLLPRASIAGIPLYFPSELLLNLTSMWRVPARLVVLVQVGLAVLSAVALYFIITRLRVRKVLRLIVVSTLIIVSFLEFLSYNPFNRSYWGYDKIPSAYTEIKNNSAVKRIAEYPLLDAPRNYAFIYYQTYQGYHDKAMINSFKVSSPTKKYRESFADLNDWQTLGVLKQLQVDRIVVHGTDAPIKDNPGLVRIAQSYDPVAGTDIYTYSLSDAVTPRSYVLTIGDGFDGPSNYGYQDIDYYMHTEGTLKPVLLPGAVKQATATARIEYYAFEKNPRLVNISQGGKLIAQVRPTELKQTIEFTVDPSRPITILPENATKDYSFVISNMELQ